MILDKLLNREYLICCHAISRINTLDGRESKYDVCYPFPLFPLFHREEFCEIFRAKDKNSLKMYTCKKFHKKDGRKVRKAAKNEIMILKM